MDWQIITFGMVIVVGLSEYIKSFDKAKSLKKFYWTLPLILSFGAGLILTNVGDTTFSIWIYLLNSLVVLGFSVTGYEAVIKFIQKQLDK